MNLRLKQLLLNCRKSTELVRFASSLSFFHGEMSTGKSSIPALVDFCLGGRFPKTPALGAELISARLELFIGENDTVIERVPDSSAVQVTWRNANGELQQCSAPTRATSEASPILAPDVFTLSDLLFHLSGETIIRVRKRTYDPESQLVRLSARDILEFNYLNQDDLDSDFFLLEVPIRKEKSQDTLRYFMGLMSDKLNDLQQELQEVRLEQRAKRESIVQIESFLTQFGFESEEKIDRDIQALLKEQEEIESKLIALRNGFRPELSVREEDRKVLANLDSQIRETDEALEDLKSRISEQESLRAEVLALKIRASRVLVAHEVLDDVLFEKCPACGSNINPPSKTDLRCYLCTSVLPVDETAFVYQPDVLRQDLDARAEDLRQSITRHKKALQPLEAKAQELVRSRNTVQDRVAETTKEHESEFLSRSRMYEKRLAAIDERIDSLKKIKAMPARLRQIKSDADALSGNIERLRREIREEETGLVSAEKNFRRLEEVYKMILLEIHFPDISTEDYVAIDRRTMVPEVVQAQDGNRWTFFDIGSGGKKTLLKICFALALHVTAAERHLPIPHLLMIDSPMKNITPDVNPDVFRNFYRALYRLLAGTLKDWQMVLIDQSYFPIPADLPNSYDRLMLRDDPKHPRLIRYYTGS